MPPVVLLTAAKTESGAIATAKTPTISNVTNFFLSVLMLMIPSIKFKVNPVYSDLSGRPVTPVAAIM